MVREQKKSEQCNGDGAGNRECIGRSKGGLSTKIHALCDALGYPLAFHLSGGNAHDLVGANALLGRVCEGSALIADKAYYAKERVLDKLEQRNITPVIPSKSNSRQEHKIDRHLYKERSCIENFFAHLKQYRAIATRNDKRANVFLGAIHLAAIKTWLN